MSGFLNTKTMKSLVLYPFNGVSEIQKRQMLKLMNENPTRTRTFAVQSDFDFCQTSVKKNIE